MQIFVQSKFWQNPKHTSVIIMTTKAWPNITDVKTTIDYKNAMNAMHVGGQKNTPPVVRSKVYK